MQKLFIISIYNIVALTSISDKVYLYLSLWVMQINMVPFRQEIFKLDGCFADGEHLTCQWLVTAPSDRECHRCLIFCYADLRGLLECYQWLLQDF